MGPSKLWGTATAILVSLLFEFIAVIRDRAVIRGAITRRFREKSNLAKMEDESWKIGFLIERNICVYVNFER